MASPFIKYLSPETRSDAWQIYCTDAGFNDVSPGGPYPPRPELHPPAFTCNLTDLTVGRVLEEFQIVYITGGRGLLSMPGRTAEMLEVSRGSAFLLLPGVPHAYRPDPETGWQEYWIGFDGEYPRQLWREGALGRGSVVFQPGLRATLIQDFDSVFQEMAEEARGFQLRAGALVMHILGSVVTGATGADGAESAGPGAALSSREGAIFRRRSTYRSRWGQWIFSGTPASAIPDFGTSSPPPSESLRMSTSSA